MEKIIQLICWIVFLMLIVATCIARTIVNQAKIDDHFHHLIQKCQINTPPCAFSLSFLTICPNYIHGNVSFCVGYADECNTITIDIHINKSNNNDICHTDDYNGNVRINDTSTYNYNINASRTICNGTFNGTATLCDKDCDDAIFDGNFFPATDNTICHPVAIEGFLCW